MTETEARTESITLPGLSGHVIVCGLRGVGLRTVEQLYLAGVQVVVVDDHPDAGLSRIVDAWGVPQITGSARTREILTAAGLNTAAAVICVEDHDLTSLEIALLVHELRPDVRLVVQLANAAVGNAVAGVLGPGSVLDVAELSAPAVVEASRARAVHPLDLDGDSFVVAEIIVDRAATLRERYAELAPVAVVRSDGETLVCPGRDVLVAPGDVVHLVGTEAQFDDFGLDWGDPQTERKRNSWPANQLGAVRHAMLTLFNESDRALRAAIAALGVVVVVATIVLHLFYVKPDGTHMSVLDGIYFSVETVGTIGYGDFSFAEQDAWLRIFAIALMMSGVLLAAIFFALLTNLLVSRRLEQSLGRRHVTGLSGHAIVIGIGSIGLRVVEGILAEGTAVVVVERDENNRYLGQARALDVPVVIADATLRRTLQDVNLSTAGSVAIMTSSDLTNIETALAVRDLLGDRWMEVPVVVRLFDRQLARTIERDFGFRHVRSTAALAAPWFVGAALGLDVLNTFFIEQQPFLVGRLHVAEKGGLDGLAMSQLSARTRVVAIRRGSQLEYPPRRDTRFAAGDVAYLVGPYEELLQVLRRDSLSVTQVVP